MIYLFGKDGWAEIYTKEICTSNTSKENQKKLYFQVPTDDW